MIEQAGTERMISGGTTTYRARGGLYTLLSPATGTDGAYSLWEAMNPPGTGVPPHIQHREEESFYVLEGTYTFWTTEGTGHHGPGEFLLAPPATHHAPRWKGVRSGRQT